MDSVFDDLCRDRALLLEIYREQGKILRRLKQVAPVAQGQAYLAGFALIGKAIINDYL